jgi:SAM-dependent methyltransferase
MTSRAVPQPFFTPVRRCAAVSGANARFPAVGPHGPTPIVPAQHGAFICHGPPTTLQSSSGSGLKLRLVRCWYANHWGNKVPDMRITYGHWREALDNFPQQIRIELDKHRPSSVCEIGGGANPALTLTEITDRGIEYTVLDISAAELAMAPDGYVKLEMDITAPIVGNHPRFDFMFSHMLAEHVKDPAAFHSNVFRMLNPNGVAIHFMPTLYDPAFVANRLLPEQVSRKMIRWLQPSRKIDANQGKFPAYYRWCRGPSPKQLGRLQSVGFHVEEVRGYFGTGYVHMLGPIARGYEAAARRLIANPKPSLCSYAWWILRRP